MWVMPIHEPEEPRSMRPTSPHHSTRRAAFALIAAALAFAALFMLLGPPRGDARGATLKVATAQNAILGKRILVTSSGRTLYSLSAETRGRFICKDSSCTSMWPPLTLGRGCSPPASEASARSDDPTVDAR
jgi:predicted lipoprotein with Yx(FWY)xxD motif